MTTTWDGSRIQSFWMLLPYILVSILLLIPYFFVRQELYLAKQLQLQLGDSLIAKERKAFVPVVSSNAGSTTGGSTTYAPSGAAHWEKVWAVAQEASSHQDFLHRLRAGGVVEAQSAVANIAHNIWDHTVGNAWQKHRGSSLDGQQGRLRAAAEPPALPQLSAELARQHARENLVLVTWTNWHFFDFVVNWARHLQVHGIRNYLVGAMDEQTAAGLQDLGIPGFAMFQHDRNSSGGGLGTANFAWGGETFHKMGRLKINLLKAFLGFGLDVMLCDSDTVWLRDPTDYLQYYARADILTSSDLLETTLQPGDSGLERPQAVHAAMNIGIMLFRHSNATKALVAEWVSRLEADDKLWDQAAFNQVARQGFKEDGTADGSGRLVWAYNRQLVLGVLPVSAFASGHTFFVQHLYKTMGLQPYVVHTTFQFGGTKGKRNRLREALLWADSREYYTEGRFITLQMTQLPPPPDLEAAADFDRMLFHLQNIQHQILQVRTGLALAVALNRTIIMPKLSCYCDRYWAPLQGCRIPGASFTQLPFVCPMDHIFEPFHFDDRPEEFGVPIAFREHSFLDNPAVPAWLKASRILLQPSMSEEGPVTTPDPDRVEVPANQTAEALSQLLAGQQAVRIIEVRDATRVLKQFLEFSDAEAMAAFTRRLAHVPGFWCCRHPDGPHGKGGTPYVPMILGNGIEFRN